MQTLFWLLLLPATLWALFYFRASLLVGTIVTAILLANWTYFISDLIVVQVAVWALFLVIAIPLNNTTMRRTSISDKALRAFRKVTPSMSQTERDALEAGSVWWDGELFSGKPDWKKLLDTPKPELTKEEKTFLNGPVQDLCDMLDDWNITQERYDLPEHVWQFMKDILSDTLSR